MRCVEYPLCPNQADVWIAVRGGKLMVVLCLDHARYERVATLRPIPAHTLAATTAELS